MSLETPALHRPKMGRMPTVNSGHQPRGIAGVDRAGVNFDVHDLAQAIRFYSTLFASEPTVVKPDYAKWMLDDPRVNFAISTSGGDHTGKVEIGDRAARRCTAGISHLGIQVEDETELAEVYGRRPKH
jgi:hypothetical protein